MTTKHGTVTANLDTTVSPRRDFYQYACGGWQKAHPLEGEYASFGTFSLLAEQARKQLRELIENLGQDPEAKVKDTIAQKIADIYAQGLDMERRNREGATPILPLLKRVEELTEENLAETLGFLHRGIDSPFFSFGVGPDPGNSDINMLHVGETGLGLGDRDYYLEKNETNDRIMAAYEVYVKRIAELTGYDAEAAQRIWDNVIRIETEFARHKKTREESRDPLLRYNIRTFDEFTAAYPNIPWKEVFRLSGLAEVKRVNVSSLKFLEFINDYLPKLSLREKKDLMLFGVISGSTGTLGDDFYDADFELYSRVMAGVEEKKPLWKRAMALPNSMFGEAVGELYVKKYFAPEKKEYMLRLVENLRAALGDHIRGLSWMSDATKSKALEKLASLKVKIGYPDKWKDYSGIHINPALPYQNNILEASRWFTADNFSKMDQPVDKEEWFMTPQTVNAYYSPLNNEICFPAGILQPPYFDFDADDAVNYGAIGVVIGHEMTHGFDDQGRHFDKKGNLEDWWEKDDEERFNALTEILVRQFDAVEVAPGVHANGRYTLGENIADQGGLRIARSAYLKSLGDKKPEDIDGFSADQRFYLGYAAVWANNIRPEEILVRTNTDPHSLSRNRVNVTLRNIEPFFEAFGIKEGDEMYRPEDERVIIW